MSLRPVNTLKPGTRARLPWAGAAVFGAAVGYGGWSLTVWARLYCEGGGDAGGGFELTLLLPLVMGAGVLSAVAALFLGRRLTRRAPKAARILTPLLLMVVSTVLLAWWVFATRGTLDGYPSHTGLCPTSNIPPQWPDWIPA
ncbi:hypothetical protein [Streptomyces sp. NPDC058953]|uniref:hypothetical protein n=1 Tax=unclassified Streptomyces TaxID=2593676 RepID=UPI0036938F64